MNNTGLNCTDPLICRCFSITMRLASWIPGLCICAFNQPRTENDGGKSADAEGRWYILICAILYKGLERQWILLSAGGCSGYQGMATVKFGGAKN